MRRAFSVCLGLVAVPALALSASAAISSDSTQCGQRDPQKASTLSSIQAIHYDRDFHMLVKDGFGDVSQSRLMLSVCRWPSLSAGVVIGSGQPASFVTGEPIDIARQDPHRAQIRLFGLELQRRFDARDAIHPIVSAGVGRVDAGWQYAYATPPAGVTRPTEGIRSSASYATAALGLELNVLTYLRAGVMGGMRVTDALATRGLDSHTIAGPYLAVSLGAGKF